MLSVFMLSCIKAECLYAELSIQPVALFCYAECLYVEFPIQTVALFCYADCLCAECRGAI
jgi:hypothetical protein